MSNLLDKHIKQEESKDMLTNIIEKNKITLVHGESGSGKTIFAIKHLNEFDIEPILVDFDDNTQAELKEVGVKALIVDGHPFMTELLDLTNGEELRKELNGSVLIIDTWSLFYKELEISEDDALKLLEKLTEVGLTIIVASHTTIYSGKEDSPDVSPFVYRHIKSRFYIRRTTLKSKIEYDLIIEKSRGYKGPKIISLRTEEKQKE